MRALTSATVLGIGFFGFSLLITWPLATCAHRCLSGNLGDPLLNAWIVGWGAERLADGFAGVWDAPIFHPHEDTLAYSEHLLGIAALVAPVYWLSANAILAYNVAFIAAYALAAFGMYVLARQLTGRAGVSFVIALAFASSPYLTTSQTTRLQMLYCGWMAIGLAGLHGYLETRSRARLAVFVVAYVMLGLSNMYLFVFFTIPVVLVMAYGMWTAARPFRTAIELGVALVMVATAMTPIALMYRAVQRDMTLERSQEENVRYSATVRSYASVWHESPLARWLPEDTVADRALFPGFTVTTLALLHVPRLLTRRRRGRTGTPVYGGPRLPPSREALRRTRRSLVRLRAKRYGETSTTLEERSRGGGGQPRPAGPEGPALRTSDHSAQAEVAAQHLEPSAVPKARSWSGVYVAAVVVAFALSLGPVPHMDAEPFASTGPYAWLLQAVPGLDGLRAPARFGVIVLLGLGALAATGLASIVGGWSRTARAAAVVAAGIAAVAEGAVAPARLVTFSTIVPAAEQAAFDWLATEPPGAVVVLPIVPEHFRQQPGGGVTQTLVYQHATLLHDRPIVNGSSGFKPPLVELLESEASPFHDPAHLPDALHMARALDVRYVMVHERDFGRPADLQRLADGLRAATEHVASEHAFGGIRIFSLRPDETESNPRPTTQPLEASRVFAVASDQSHRVVHALDRDPSSHWSSGAPQTGTEWLSLHFDEPIDVAHLRLSLDDGALGNYPRRLHVLSIGADGDTRTLFEGSPMVPLALALVRRPADRVIDLAFDANRTQQLLLRQVGRSAVHDWAVHEIGVWERGGE